MPPQIILTVSVKVAQLGDAEIAGSSASTKRVRRDYDEAALADVAVKRFRQAKAALAFRLAERDLFRRRQMELPLEAA